MILLFRRSKITLASLFAFLLAAIAFALPFPYSGLRADEIAYFADGEESRRLEFGSGRDGVFSDGASLPGMSVVGAAVTVNTDVKSVFEFSSFTLSGGTTLTATGSAPLIIRVTGSATIAGAIIVDGSAGQNANGAARGNGGAPGAGGGIGGVGSTTGSTGGDGQPRSGYSIGGGGAPNDVTFSTQRAGGGGCNGLGALAGYRFPAGAATCPAAQAQNAGAFEQRFFGGVSGTKAGGGGGGGGGTDDDVATNMIHGAGGGGGGGAVAITVFGALEFSGSISATGGDGGDGSLVVNDYGSSGGGGSGGSIWIQTAGVLSGAGAIDVAAGQGGIDAFTTSLGGNGSVGVVRIDARSNAFTGTVSPSGSADRVSSVLPISVGFTLDAGPACGTLAGIPGSHERDSSPSRSGNPVAAGLPAILLLAHYAWLRARRERKL